MFLIFCILLLEVTTICIVGISGICRLIGIFILFLLLFALIFFLNVPFCVNNYAYIILLLARSKISLLKFVSTVKDSSSSSIFFFFDTEKRKSGEDERGRLLSRAAWNLVDPGARVYCEFVEMRISDGAKQLKRRKSGGGGLAGEEEATAASSNIKRGVKSSTRGIGPSVRISGVGSGACPPVYKCSRTLFSKAFREPRSYRVH